MIQQFYLLILNFEMIDITYCPGQLIWNKAEVHNVFTSLLIFVIKFITYVTTDPMDCYVKVGSWKFSVTELWRIIKYMTCI